MIKYLFILIILPILLSANNYYWSFSNHNESWQNDKLIIRLDEPYFLNLINDSPLTTLNIASSINFLVDELLTPDILIEESNQLCAVDVPIYVIIFLPFCFSIKISCGRVSYKTLIQAKPLIRN